MQTFFANRNFIIVGNKNQIRLNRIGLLVKEKINGRNESFSELASFNKVIEGFSLTSLQHVDEMGRGLATYKACYQLPQQAWFQEAF